jgi:hypothetical protein
MSKEVLRAIAFSIAIITTALSFPASGQENPSLKEIVKKNLQSSGGKERLLQIQNVSFKTGGTRCYATTKGELKLVTGKDPVITEVILAQGDKVQKNSFQAITDITGPQKDVYLTLAKLYAGLFSLRNFEGKLKLEGLKAYGPEKLYHLTTLSGALKVGFFLRTDDFSLKRLVLEGSTSEGDKYEVNFDFAPFEETEGLKIPLSWFSSQVGTRGNLVEVAEVKTNQPLAQDFFAKLEVNVGTTEAAAGLLRGNVLDSNFSPYGLTINTNWTKKDVEKAGLRSGDKLAFLVDGVESEVVFFASANEIPPQNELAKGARLMTPMPRGGENYVIQFFAVDTAQIAAKLKPLAPIEIRRK